jgi:hypothetical protein
VSHSFSIFSSIPSNSVISDENSYQTDKTVPRLARLGFDLAHMSAQGIRITLSSRPFELMCILHLKNRIDQIINQVERQVPTSNELALTRVVPPPTVRSQRHITRVRLRMMQSEFSPTETSRIPDSGEQSMAGGISVNSDHAIPRVRRKLGRCPKAALPDEFFEAIESRRQIRHAEIENLKAIRRQNGVKKLLDQAEDLERWAELASGLPEVNAALIAAAQDQARDKRARALKLSV